MYEFEPYKVWPKVQTDSLIFRICKRTTRLENTNQTIYIRSSSRKTSLLGLLDIYKKFDPNNPTMDKEIKYKINDSDQMSPSKHSSFAFILPTASCLDELNSITAHFPRLCDGENSKSITRANTPLNWNRGPNTNPVYSLVVRTKWARETFGLQACDRWLKPCFYWNGKTISSSSGGGKEGEFWRERDPSRLGRKEMSAAEAYWPFCNLDTEDPGMAFYSLILVNKEDADYLKKLIDEEGQNSPYYSLYSYLKEARQALQGDQTNKEIVHCQYNKCGTEVPVKIVHPINCGYYTRSQPRQRFFADYTRAAVTNQCIYFTIKPSYPCQNADYFCGLLNSVLLQFFGKVHCCYDQQGRMRFFGRLMAYVPFAPPPSNEFMDQVATFVQGMTESRTWIYSFVRYTNCEWHLSEIELNIIQQFSPPENWTLQPDTSLSTFHCPPYLDWITKVVTNQTCLSDRNNVEHVFITLLKISSLFQYAIDQMIYHIYKIPIHLQLEIEEDLNLLGIRREWEGQRELLYDATNRNGWFNHIINLAKSFTTIKNTNTLPSTLPSTTTTTSIIDDTSPTPSPRIDTNIDNNNNNIPISQQQEQPVEIPQQPSISTVEMPIVKSQHEHMIGMPHHENLIRKHMPTPKPTLLPVSIRHAINLMQKSRSEYNDYMDEEEEDEEDIDILTINSDSSMADI
jgi:hypothetical protein